MSFTAEELAHGALTPEEYAEKLRAINVPDSWVKRLSAAPTDGMPHCMLIGDSKDFIISWHDWNRTPEGHDFWSWVHVHVSKLGIDNGFSSIGSYEEAIETWGHTNDD